MEGELLWENLQKLSEDGPQVYSVKRTCSNTQLTSLTPGIWYFARLNHIYPRASSWPSYHTLGYSHSIIPHLLASDRSPRAVYYYFDALWRTWTRATWCLNIYLNILPWHIRSLHQHINSSGSSRTGTSGGFLSEEPCPQTDPSRHFLANSIPTALSSLLQGKAAIKKGVDVRGQSFACLIQLPNHFRSFRCLPTSSNL